MNYLLHYEALINKASQRSPLDSYTETHHIVPRCIGGEDIKENLIALIPEEHYVAHQLLTKMFPNHVGLAWAAVNMSGGNRFMQRGSNKLYGWLRRRWSESLSVRFKGRKLSDEARQKMSQAHMGRKRKPHSEETKQKMSLAAIGKKKSAEHIANSAKARTGLKYGPRSAECRTKMSMAIKKAMLTSDRTFMSTPEYKEKQRQNMLRIWAERKVG